MADLTGSPTPAEPGHWPQGDAEIEGMVERGELEYVQPSPEHAQFLMEQAAGHLTTADPLTRSHPPSAFTLAARRRTEAPAVQSRTVRRREPLPPVWLSA